MKKIVVAVLLFFCMAALAFTTAPHEALARQPADEPQASVPIIEQTVEPTVEPVVKPVKEPVKKDYSGLFAPMGEPSVPASAEIIGSERVYAPADAARAVLSNRTTLYYVNGREILARGVRVEPVAAGEVQVLIVHTHATEAYADTYAKRREYRTVDSSMNMLRVGAELQSALAERGIVSVQCRTLCDEPDYVGAYDVSLAQIERYKEKYPTANIIIDLHRDAYADKNGNYCKATASVNGKTAAQMMLVTGTDGSGLYHSNWRDNLSFQMLLQDRLVQAYPGLMRDILIKDSRYNQHVSAGSMLIEMGTNANTLEEVLYSARLLASVLADVLLGK